jgi:hypothetical protein
VADTLCCGVKFAAVPHPPVSVDAEPIASDPREHVQVHMETSWNAASPSARNMFTPSHSSPERRNARASRRA